MAALNIDQDRLRNAQRTRECGFPRLHCDDYGYRRLTPTSTQRDGYAKLWSSVKDRALVYFYGGFGVGKTLLATGVGFQWMGMYDRENLPDGLSGYPRYWNARDLFEDMEEWRRGDQERGSPIKLAERVGLLILDELGQSRFTEYQSTEIGAIVDKRLTEGKPTILIANESPDKIVRLGLSPRVIDRTKQGGRVIDASRWKNQRGEK